MRRAVVSADFLSPSAFRQFPKIASEGTIWHPNPLVTAISLLSDREVQLMNRSDLLETLRIARHTRGEGHSLDAIHDLSDAALRRLVCLLRRCLRYQINQCVADGASSLCFPDAC